MIWTRKSSPDAPADRNKLLGLDLTASRARAVAVTGGHSRALEWEPGRHDLMMFLGLERRTPELGRSGYAICRKHPHLVCTNFLPCLGMAREWRGSRLTLSPETALTATFEAMRAPIVAEADGFAMVLPSYLTASQVKTVNELATKAKLPLRGTAIMPLAIAAHRAASVLSPKAESKDSASHRPDWVVPIRTAEAGPGAVVMIDVDEYALSATTVYVDRGEVRILSAGAWPRVSLKVWKDRLIDSLSDRCVRLCRRDPRDSADAEQSMYEQLDAALDAMRAAQPATLTVRAEKWYQDIVQQPAEFDGYCTPLVNLAWDNIREVIGKANLPLPPRAVWLTDSAAKLPGLAAMLYQNSAEQTEVAMLPIDAATEAAAALHARWLAATLPRTHLDRAIPIDLPIETASKTTKRGVPSAK